tara:strand:- start:65 stop:274 length:210 start_codon:yes stop_codon:yes gene_type:complete
MNHPQKFLVKKQTGLLSSQLPSNTCVDRPNKMTQTKHRSIEKLQQCAQRAIQLSVAPTGGRLRQLQKKQ